MYNSRIKISGYDVGIQLKSIESYEAESNSIIPKKLPRPVFYNGAGNLIVSNKINRIFNLKTWIRLLMGKQSLSDVFYPVSYTYSSAARIYLGNNVLVFYPKQNILCKIGINQGGGLMT